MFFDEVVSVYYFFFVVNYGMYTQVLVYVYVGQIYVYKRLCYYSIIILLLRSICPYTKYISNNDK